jgi:outer membrane receptor protein involved in Fe transport
VTGLTIEDGKYVIIRGQPSRYSFTTWNRSPLPSPDPIKRIVPLDLFPTGTLSSLEVQKSYSADKPGEFGAGLIALNTKGVPEGPVAEVSVGAGYDSRATGKDALTFKGGNEILGDAGSDLRMPGPVDDATNGGDDSLNLLDPAIKGDLAQSFPNRWSPESTTFPADHSLSLTLGDRFSLWGGEYGVLGSFSWSRDYEITEESEKGFDEGLAVETDYDRTKYDQNIDLGGMLVIGGEWGENHKVTSNSFFIRKTKKRVQVEDGFNFTSESRFEKNFLLEWNQREMFAQQLIGDHQLPWFHLDWRGLIASSNRLSPDRRQYKLFETGGEFEIYDQLGGLRRYNETTSNTNSYQLSLDRDWLDNDTWKLNTELGAFQSGMDRESKAATFQFFPTEATDTDVPEEAFDPAKVPDSMDLRSFPQSSADYEGTKSIQAFFGQVTTTWNDLLRFVAGARNETSELDVTTFSAFAPDGVDSGYEQTNTLKTLSATWFMNETMQVRAAYGESLSHPLLVELSDTGYFHPDTGEVHRGNPDLEPAEITGYDLRWEWYPSEEESLSLGYFRKAYTNPIETVFIPLAGGGEQITKDNADSATVSGYEASVRIGLGPLATGVDWLEPAYLRANGALIDSQVDYGGDPGLVTNPERPLQGQADQIINIQLGYSTDAVNYALVYNRVGERLAQVGNKGEPDIYRDPLTTVDLVASWRLGEHWSVKFKGENLTQPDIVFTQGDKTQKTVSQSRSFSLELKWAL